MANGAMLPHVLNLYGYRETAANTAENERDASGSINNDC